MAKKPVVQEPTNNYVAVYPTKYNGEKYAAGDTIAMTATDAAELLKRGSLLEEKDAPASQGSGNAAESGEADPAADGNGSGSDAS